MDMTMVGKFLAELRKQHGYSQEELGEKIGVTNKTISRWETGSGCPDRHGSASSQPIHNISHDLPLR